MKRTALVAVVIATFSTPVVAQQGMPVPAPATQGAQQQKVSAMTQEFVKNAAITDMFEIQAGKLAQDKATNSAHKEFGKMLVDDHTKTSEQMKMMAPKIGAQLPTELDSKHKSVAQKLQSADGAKFDDQFKAAQIDGHKDAIKLFENYAQKGDNADLKQFAQQTLPKLKEHLQHAQQLPKGGQAPTVGSGTSRAR